MDISISIIDRIYSFFYTLYLQFQGAQIESGVFFMYNVKLLSSSNNIKVGKKTFFSRNVYIKSPIISIGENSIFYSNTRIICLEELTFSSRTKISNNCFFKARKIIAGHDLWVNDRVIIGGGGWESKNSHLKIGCFQFIGSGAFINVSEPVVIEGWGGIGNEAMIYTRSAGEGQSFLEGFSTTVGAVRIEKNVSVYTRAIILPNVTLGQYSTIGAYSLVRKNVDNNQFVSGIPAKYISQSQKDFSFSEKENMLHNFFAEHLTENENGELYINDSRVIYKKSLSKEDIVKQKAVSTDSPVIYITFENNECFKINGKKETLIDLNCRFIQGRSSSESEYLRDKFRQKGLRLDYLNYQPKYIDWRELVERGIELL